MPYDNIYVELMDNNNKINKYSINIIDILI